MFGCHFIRCLRAFKSYDYSKMDKKNVADFEIAL